MNIKPLHDRVLVRWLDDPEHLDSDVIALVKQDVSLAHQAGADPAGDAGDYRRVIRRAVVVAVGSGKRNADGDLIPVAVRPRDKVRATWWDDLEGLMPGHALLREADIVGVEQKGA